MERRAKLDGKRNARSEEEFNLIYTKKCQAIGARQNRKVNHTERFNYQGVEMRSGMAGKVGRNRGIGVGKIVQRDGEPDRNRSHGHPVMAFMGEGCCYTYVCLSSATDHAMHVHVCHWIWQICCILEVSRHGIARI